MEKERITVKAAIASPVEQTWDYYTNPEHMVHWNFASDDWQCPSAESDLRTGGHFSARMEARDGSRGFDFGGTYQDVRPNERLVYAMTDGRQVSVLFHGLEHGTDVTVSFDPETEH